MTTDYYADKHEILADLWGADEVEVAADSVTLDGTRLPVLDDVIVATSPSEWSPQVAQRLGGGTTSGQDRADFARDIQSTFGREWLTYGEVLPEHEDEFLRYFDLVDLEALSDSRAMDLGCGMGRWSYYLAPHCREIVLVDFSDAIFAARRNLQDRGRAIFVQGDITRLPFRDDAADLAFCLGVLHHLPLDCLAATRSLARLAPELLIFLYYALDNRPVHYRVLLAAVTGLRRLLCRVQDETMRARISRGGARYLYRPLVGLGRFLDRWGWGSHVPLYDFYRDRSLDRIEQDVYDRFFTRIEQRVSRRQIEALGDTFSKVTLSADLPYWHFTCSR